LVNELRRLCGYTYTRCDTIFARSNSFARKDTKFWHASIKDLDFIK
jgi:hypothetical protein